MSNFDFKSLSKSFGSKWYTELTFKFSASSIDVDVKSTSLPRVDSSFLTFLPSSLIASNSFFSTKLPLWSM